MSTTHIEIETVDQLRAAAPNLAGQVVQGVDLTGCSNLLRHCDVSTTIFLGCSTSARLAAWLRARGALIFRLSRGSHSIPTTRAPTQRRNCTTTSARVPRHPGRCHRQMAPRPGHSATTARHPRHCSA